MGVLFAMTLPFLVLALTALGAAVQLDRRRRARADGPGRPGAAGTAALAGFDVLGEALYPGRRHAREAAEAQSLLRQPDDPGAPPRSRVDLDGGTARIVLPRPDGGGRP